MASLRTKLFTYLDPEAWPEPGLSPLNKAILTVIGLSIVAAILESEPTVKEAFPQSFFALNVFLAIVFLAEYLVRLWAMGEDQRFGGVLGRVRYACTFTSIVDLVVALALWIDIIFGVQGVYGVVLRLVRVLRVFSLARNSDWAAAIFILGRAIRDRRRELCLSLGLAMIIMLASATLLFVVEGPAQPEAFGSIPRAMWWSMATLTTVGYGDVYPITPFGRLLAGISAITSIAIVAMPTGIMAAAVSDTFQQMRKIGRAHV